MSGILGYLIPNYVAGACSQPGLASTQLRTEMALYSSAEAGYCVGSLQGIEGKGTRKLGSSGGRIERSRSVCGRRCSVI